MLVFLFFYPVQDDYSHTLPVLPPRPQAAEANWWVNWEPPWVVGMGCQTKHEAVMHGTLPGTPHGYVGGMTPWKTMTPH